MSEVVVYAARPESVLEASMLLQRHGIACRVAQGPAIAMPWVFAAQPRQQLLVPEQFADRARAVLRPLQAEQRAQAERALRGVRVWLLVLALGTVGVIAFGIGTIGESAWSAPVALACAIAAFVAVVRLLRGRTRRGEVGA